ncbi:unnamed protein product [Lampetra planeri]
MSKHLKKNNPPVPFSDEDDDPLSQELADPVAATTAGSTKGPCKDVELSSSPAVEDGWKRLAEQIDSLQAVLLNLVTLIASSTRWGPAREMPSSGNGLGSHPRVVEERAAIVPATGTTWRETAILGAATSARPDAANFSEQRGMRLAEQIGEAASAGDGSVQRSNRLPNIKVLSAGGDWNAFTWRFESAFHSVKWTEDEAREALPTLLDDVSLAVFRVLQVRLDGLLRTRLPESSPSSLVARASTFGVVYRVGPYTGPGNSAITNVTVEVPPGAQMLIPLRYQKPLGDVDASAGILLSKSAARSFSFVAVQTIVRAGQAPFIQVLNGGPDGVVVPAGVVLAHATTAFTDCEENGPRILAVGTCHDANSNNWWIAELCWENLSLSGRQRDALRALLSDYTDVFRKRLVARHPVAGDGLASRTRSKSVPFR